MKRKAPASDSYSRTPDYSTRLAGVQLPPEVWAVFAMTESPASTDDIARRLKLPKESVVAAIRRLLRRKLLQKHVLGWDAYVGTVPTKSEVAQKAESTSKKRLAPSDTLILPPVSNAFSSEPPSPTLTPAEPSDPPVVSVRFESPLLSRNAAQDEGIVSCSLGAPRSTPRWCLKSIINMIAEKGGGGVAGQLLVYRVFLKVPTALMETSKLYSLASVTDDFEVTDPRLIEAISTAVRTVAAFELELQAA